MMVSGVPSASGIGQLRMLVCCAETLATWMASLPLHQVLLFLKGNIFSVLPSVMEMRTVSSPASILASSLVTLETCVEVKLMPLVTNKKLVSKIQ